MISNSFICFLMSNFILFAIENPQLMEAVTTKYESLHDRLKTVFVESQGVNPEVSCFKHKCFVSKE